MAEVDREAQYADFVQDNLKRNYLANFVHGMLGMTGFRLIYAPTIVPAYLYLLSGSPFLVGLGMALLQVGAVFSPVMGASWIEHRTRVLPTAVFVGVMMRVQILALALVGWWLVERPLLWATFAILFLLGFFNGAQRVIFQFLMAKVVPIERRGSLQAWRNLAGGAVAAVLAYWAGVSVIDTNMWGNGFGTTFLLALILTSLGLLMLCVLLREPELPSVRGRISLRRRVRQFPGLLQNTSYRNFLIAQILAAAGRIAVPFCIVYAGQVMALDGKALGLLSLAFLGADTLSNLLWGRLGDRCGFRLVLMWSVAIWFLALLCILMADARWQFLLGFVGLGAALSGYLMSTTTMVLEFGEREDVPMRLALSSSAETAMAVVGPLLGGLAASVTGLVPVFVVSMLCLGLSFLVLVFWVCDPRHSKSE
ncbi:MFS transporter [Pseudomaricurvus sp.]|uniref:MFS transporter n=1 Tax=Pseudomaricurvus sp. TaxID=2004510 RepID=UPI003F6D8638